MEIIGLSFNPHEAKELHKAFVMGNKVSIRILRRDLKPLDYVFPVHGYIAAFNKIKKCQ